MIEISIQQPKGRLKVLFAGTYPEAKSWARRTFAETKIWYRDADWKVSTDETMTYNVHKAGFSGYPGVSRISGPVAARFFGG